MATDPKNLPARIDFIGVRRVIAGKYLWNYERN